MVLTALSACMVGVIDSTLLTLATAAVSKPAVDTHTQNLKLQNVYKAQ